VDVGKSATLRCEAESNPPPNIVWRKKGAYQALSTSSTLHLSAVNEGQFGQYICSASNLGFNEKSREIYLLRNGEFLAPAREGCNDISFHPYVLPSHFCLCVNLRRTWQILSKLHHQHCIG
jgi:hypothetical protein